MDGNGETTIFYVEVWFIIQLKQPFINRCFRFQVHPNVDENYYTTVLAISILDFVLQTVTFCSSLPKRLVYVLFYLPTLQWPRPVN